MAIKIYKKGLQYSWYLDDVENEILIYDKVILFRIALSLFLFFE